MSTSGSECPKLSDLFDMLQSLTNEISLHTVLDELQLVVERITFSGIAERQRQASQEVFTDLDLYFEEEVTPEMMQFIRWCASKSELRALSDDAGRSFLEYCIIEYRKIQEIRFVTAVHCGKIVRTKLIDRLRTQFPEPARIVFDVSHSLIAGFVIESGDEIYDASLRTHINTLIARDVRVSGVSTESGASRG